MPAGQRVHTSLDCLACPALHRQSPGPLLPSTESDDAGQARHCELSVDEYDPPAQSAHAFVVEAVGARNLPGSHCVHAVCSVVLYLPAAQASHSLPDSTAKPALHLQSPGPLLPSTESDEAGQGRHSER